MTGETRTRPGLRGLISAASAPWGKKNGPEKTDQKGCRGKEKNSPAEARELIESIASWGERNQTSKNEEGSFGPIKRRFCKARMESRLIIERTH